MRSRMDRDDGPLRLQALYSLTTLARVAGVTKQTLTRVLRANGVALLGSGRALLVPLSEIRARIPHL
jgi:hypothetical protein